MIVAAPIEVAPIVTAVVIVTAAAIADSRNRGSDGSSRGSSYSTSSPSQGFSSDPAAPKTSYRVKTATELLPQGLDPGLLVAMPMATPRYDVDPAQWDADVAKKFQQLDANGDGFISANEALRSAPSSRAKSVAAW